MPRELIIIIIGTERMKTVKQIFCDDIISLSKNFFALVIAIGVCFLPALYAWFNIFSNWDPYGNTGELKLAAVSLDEGYTDRNGEYHNQGDAIIEQLHDNTSVNWQFVNSEEEAVKGVNSGKYYAAVVVDEKFSYNMYNVFSEESEEPNLIFYENQKKNAVATKISDTVVSTLQNNINEAFIEVVISEVFSGAGEAYQDIDEDQGTDGIVDNLKHLHKDLTAYEKSINQIIVADEVLSNNIELAKSDADTLTQETASSADALEKTKNEVAKTQTTLNSYSKHMNSTFSTVLAKLNDMQAILARGVVAKDVGEMQDALTQVNKDIIAIKQVTGSMDAATAKYINLILDNLLKGSSTTKYMQMSENELRVFMRETSVKVSSLQQEINSILIPKANKSIDDLEEVVENAATTMRSLSTTFGYSSDMLSSVNDTIDAANVSLEQTNEALAYMNAKLATTIELVDAVAADQKMEAIINNLSSNAEAYGAFFSEPVEIVTEAVYPIENYGSAVAPFYTTLAIWVGALILTAIIKVHPDKSKYPTANNIQMYFGRYLTFWVMAQFQAVVIVIGDVCIFKIQCLHPGWFMLAASFAATTFSILIYSLVITWGDVGKALSVVIVVLQIAGSSGTYPIELLPEFFQKVYIFFPFPYSINAMRECICGFYEMDYAIFLLELSAFIVVSLVVGILLRIPFEELNHYMEERMEETEMM